MKVGSEWLRSWIDLPVSNIQLNDQLNNLGIESEIEKYNYFSSYFSEVFIGKILRKKSDFLCKDFKMYEVEIKKNKIIYVLHSEDIKIFSDYYIVVALKSSILYKNYVLEQKNFFEKYSEGIFCTYSMLKIKKNNLSIFFLPKSVAKVGDLLSQNQYFCDDIFKIDVPTNRLDLQSIIGISRDLAISYNLTIPKIPIFPINYNFLPCKSDVNLYFPDFNYRYFFREIYNIKIDKNFYNFFSVIERLRKSNLLTNNIFKNIIYYIFLETGVWIHIFDLDHVSSDLKISFLKDFNIKKDKKLYLNKIFSHDSIIITNFKKMFYCNDVENFDDSYANLKTKNLFLGVLFFDDSFLHYIKNEKFSNFLNIEKNKFNFFNKEDSEFILDYVTTFIINLFSGKASILKYKIQENVSNSNSFIALSLNKINMMLENVFTKKIVFDVLRKGCFSIYDDKKIFFVKPPKWRHDIIIEEDVINEFIRLYGINNISSVSLSNSSVFISLSRSTKELFRYLQLFLVHQGYREVINYSFINPKLQKFFFTTDQFLMLKNPISQEMSVMRSSLWVGLLQTISYNQKRQINSIKIFEIGLCFFKNKNFPLHIKQEEYLSGVISGNFNRRTWYEKIRNFDFYDLKGDLESLFKIVNQFQNISFVPRNYSGLQHGKSAAIFLNNQIIGKIGELDLNLYDIFDVTSPIVLFEISCNILLNFKDCTFLPFSTLPIIQRDISIIVSNSVMVIDLINICKKNVNKLCVDIYVYDIYKGLGIPIGSKSVSICFKFNNGLKKIDESKISKILENCIQALKIKFKVILRD